MSFVHSPANRVKHRMSGSKQEVYAAQLQVFASALALSGSSRNEEDRLVWGGRIPGQKQEGDDTLVSASIVRRTRCSLGIRFASIAAGHGKHGIARSICPSEDESPFATGISC